MFPGVSLSQTVSRSETTLHRLKWPRDLFSSSLLSLWPTLGRNDCRWSSGISANKGGRGPRERQMYRLNSSFYWSSLWVYQRRYTQRHAATLIFKGRWARMRGNKTIITPICSHFSIDHRETRQTKVLLLSLRRGEDALSRSHSALWWTNFKLTFYPERAADSRKLCLKKSEMQIKLCAVKVFSKEWVFQPFQQL